MLAVDSDTGGLEARLRLTAEKKEVSLLLPVLTKLLRSDPLLEPTIELCRSLFRSDPTENARSVRGLVGGVVGIFPTGELPMLGEKAESNCWYSGLERKRTKTSLSII